MLQRTPPPLLEREPEALRALIRDRKKRAARNHRF